MNVNNNLCQFFVKLIKWLCGGRGVEEGEP